jgi:endonuclease III related protein
MANMKKQKELMDIYTSLLKAFGHRNWWPADGPFEVIVGAILTQNVAWKNAKRAIDNLKEAQKLDPIALHESRPEDIAPLIRSSRFYNMKAVKIKNFMDFYFREYGGSLEKMSSEDPDDLREKLLAVKGLGDETADAIMLYACGMPIFVVDAYTRRIFSRYGTFDKEPSYGEVQEYFMENLPGDTALFNDFHAQIVHLGHAVCKTVPVCDSCPIARIKGRSCQHYKTK